MIGVPAATDTENLPVPTHSEIESWTHAELKEQILARANEEDRNWIALHLPPDVDGAHFLKYGGDAFY